MAIPMLRLLHQKIPNAEISLGVLSESSRQLFETCPFIKRVIKVETKGRHLVKKNLNLLLRVRRDYEFDFCLMTCITGYFYLSVDSIIARCLHSERRIGFLLSANRLSFLPFQFLQLLMDDYLTIDFSKHYAENNVELLKFVGISAGNEIPEMKLWLTKDDIAAADTFLIEHNIKTENLLIGIHPGGNQWIMKRWQKEKFASLIDEFHSEYPDARFLIFGGPDEESLKNEITNLVINTKPLVVSSMSLRSTAALIEKCNLFIGNDSSLMHIAAAVKTPVVGIFGPTSPIATGPYSKKSKVVTNSQCELNCRPCYHKVSFAPIKFNCRHTPPYACLTELSVAEVLKAAKNLFNETNLTYSPSIKQVSCQ